MKNCAIILASGTGSRLGLDIPKQFYKINDKTVLEYSIEAFENHKAISSVIIVSHPDYIDLTKEISFKYSKVRGVIKGGSTRQKSAYNALNALAGKWIDNVLIHDAVRPFINSDIIDNCIKALEKYQAVNVVLPVSDTIIEIDENNLIKKVPDRALIKRCQTPQCFRYAVIKEAHELAQNENYNSATDDCSLVLRYDLTPVYAAEGSEDNIKITYPSDIIIAKEILKRKNKRL